jgi:uncharacterized lipoprotein YddW (UPF0748 family)
MCFMSSARRLLLFRRGFRPLLSAVLLLILPLGLAGFAAAPEPPAGTEVRAMWVLRTSLTSPASIAAVVRAASDNGFNTLFVQVRGRGDAYFNGGVEPRAADLQRQPADFDPLAAILASAHAAGLSVHAWVNVNLVSSAVDLPIAREHIVHRHPDWLMVPREIAQSLAKVPAGSPGYLGQLARYTRARPNELEGLYASPIIPAAVDYMDAVVRDMAQRYPLDGFHFDYARYPNSKFDYSRAALAQFREAVRPRLEPALRRQLDARQAIDLFAYTDARPDDWRTFRISRMTQLMRRLSATVKQERPGAIVSVAAKPELRDAYDERLQDWGTWINDGIVDVICPMAYTPDAAMFAEQIASARAAAGARPIWAGIGAYRLSPAQTVANIQTARRLGAEGIILFSYDSLSDPRAAVSDYLAQVARGAFAASVASSGSR